MSKVYIHLFHGRQKKEENPEDWGSTGPVIGPFEAVQITYRDHLVGVGEAGERSRFTYVNELVYYDGTYYGDVDITSGSVRGIDITKAEPFDITKATLPK